MKPVIEVSDISKSYQISHQNRASYGTLKDDFAKIIKGPFGGRSESEKEIFWALKNINFQVNSGETFGIIGKNGSGKSTLLKILSRIVDPTTGSVKIHGKVASMLEVCTGFHPELTGRENVYFNGSIIGMSKREISQKFDEIVAFSGVEQFLDTPVKFYSSGMYVRLAFAVAAHLDSEVLIIDEVLAVGDTEFQKKSLAKMLSIAKEGKTILFVSHGMNNVQELCDRAMLLEKGKIKIIDRTDMVIDRYLGRTATSEKANRTRIVDSYKQIAGKLVYTDLSGVKSRSGRGGLKVTKVTFKSGNSTGKLVCGEDGEIWIEYDLTDRSVEAINLAVGIDSLPDKHRIAHISNQVLGKKISASSGLVKILIKKVPLNPGDYGFTVFADNSGDILDWIKDAGTFRVESKDFYESGILPEPDQGPLLLSYKMED